MRLTALVFACCLALPATVLAAEIERVELHRTGATIPRSVVVELDPASPVVEIANLPTGVGEQLKVTANGDTLIRNVEVDIVRNNQAFNDAVTAKRAEIAAVEADIGAAGDNTRIARMKLSFSRTQLHRRTRAKFDPSKLGQPRSKQSKTKAHVSTPAFAITRQRSLRQNRRSKNSARNSPR